jgi:hypothetical protein
MMGVTMITRTGQGRMGKGLHPKVWVTADRICLVKALTAGLGWFISVKSFADGSCCWLAKIA